jgi:hypothetical protein
MTAITLNNLYLSGRFRLRRALALHGFASLDHNEITAIHQRGRDVFPYIRSKRLKANSWARVERIRALVAIGDHRRALVDAAELDARVFPRTTAAQAEHDVTADEKMIYAVASRAAAQGLAAGVALMRAVEHVIANDIPGDFVECGVYKGASEVMIARTLLRLGVDARRIWLFDTFAGMTAPTQPDDMIYDGSPLAPGDMKGTLAEVMEACNATGYPRHLFKYAQGPVEETLPGWAPERIALLRLDTDFYRSTKHEMETLFPRLAPGGILIVDDYGAFAGARRAVDEYVAEHGLRLFLSRVDEHVRIAVKEVACAGIPGEGEV